MALNQRWRPSAGCPHGSPAATARSAAARERRPENGVARSRELGTDANGARPSCHAEPAGEASRLPRTEALVSRDPSFLRMTRRVKVAQSGELLISGTGMGHRPP